MVRSAIVVLIGLSAVFAHPSRGAEPAVDFLRDVKPILAQRCYKCHSSLQEESSFRVDSVAGILKGGDHGPAVVPGKSSESRLIEAVLQTGDLKMPPEGSPLTEAQIASIRAWIDAGAQPPSDDSVAKITHWSFQKPVRAEAPQVADPAWAANPIDAFVAAKHAELKLTPVGEAPPNLLLRRVYLDLIGLPPTPEQLATDQAYEAVVDQLLASPHYGERWGRHWMDVWRYSDWDGYGNEVRESKPHIWRWRDWIVESLNDDKPYDRMVQEMLAADELAPDDPEALRATGYLVRSWYKFNRNKWLDDAVEHTGKAFLGVTFNCCRCHDHMYDPLSHEEYYRLRAVFEPYDVRTDRVPGESNTDKSGLVRVFDAKADAPTFVFVRGNEKEPLKDNPLAPAVPKVFAGVPFAIEPVTFEPPAYYQGLVGFVREETLSAAKEELTKALAAAAAAEKTWAEVLAVPPQPVPERTFSTPALAPSPPQAVFDADSEMAVARARLSAAQANVASIEARIAADDANYAVPPAANAGELSLAAARAERLAGWLQAQKGLLESESKLFAAQRAKKPDDMKSAKALTDAESVLSAAIRARAEAAAARERTDASYTRLSPVHPATSTGRRLALARWITSPDNPLAARVAVNHIWLRHFGSPLVPTVFDFGMNGKPPTNQPLLDWLAVELMESGWRMKHIHRLIVTSRTYRLSSGFRVEGSEVPDSHQNPEPRTLNPSIDPENIYYWRANSRRLEAEAVRDATLAVAGSLDVTRGGPELDQNAGLTVPRRSIYFRASKEKKMQFLSLFDSANPVECYRRSESIAPQQALAMANSTLTLAQSRILAKKLRDSLGNVAADEAPRRFVACAFVRTLCREPSQAEMATCLEFLTQQAALLADPKSLTAFSAGPAAAVPPSSDPAQRARENLVHVLLNHNDFVTVR